jgi:energy-coupling factor transport system ATP-binding protein
MSEISVSALRYVYGRGTPFEKVAIDDVNVTIPSGQLVGIIGHTGSGKSTFIQHLNGLLRPHQGTVCLDGQDIFRSKEATLAARFQVGLVFQYPEYQLFEETCAKDIAFGPGNMGLSPEEIHDRVLEAARFAGVPEEYLDQSPLDLSGGQKRRVAIAGVIAMRPGVLVLDEPTAGLDPAGRQSILQNIRDYHAATGATVILVTHDMDEIARLADRILVFSQGRLVMDGTPGEVFSRDEALTALHLAVPSATAIAGALRRRGVPLPDGIFTLEQLESAILACRREGAPC